jgi:hypothetical protein
MAATVVKNKELSFGDVRGAVFTITMTGVTDFDFAIADHGFSNILIALDNNETSEQDGLLEKNYTVANAASIGNIALTGYTSGDVVSVFVIGN